MIHTTLSPNADYEDRQWARVRMERQREWESESGPVEPPRVRMNRILDADGNIRFGCALTPAEYNVRLKLISNRRNAERASGKEAMPTAEAEWAAIQQYVIDQITHQSRTHR